MSGIIRTTRTALKAIRCNLLRSALTMLGVIIGVAAVIAMMEIGQGSSVAVQQNIERMGTNNLMIQPGAASSGGISMGGGSTRTLTLQDSMTIARECGDRIVNVAPTVRARTQVVYGNRNWVPYYVFGTTPAYLDVRDWADLAEGHAFTEQDVRNGSQVCLLGQTLVNELFEGRSPLGRVVRVNNQPFTVIGVLQAKGANLMGFDQDDMLLAPWTAIRYKVTGSALENVNQSGTTTADLSQQVNTLNNRFPLQRGSLYPVRLPSQVANTPQNERRTNVDVLWVKVGAADDIPVVKRQIAEVLRREHRLAAGVADDFSIRDMTEQSSALGSTTRLMGGLLLAVALISLVVGGVGIMNIMLVSVTERTREIGLRMAVGATPREILRQFLVEAVIICVAGGAVGILLGRGGSLLVRTWLHWPTQSSVWAIVASVTVSVGVGVIFGFYPAWKASRLDPIQALRYE